MVAGAVATIIHGPGRLIVGPTEVFDGGTHPYGGTEIGLVNQAVVTPLGRPYRIENEGLGEASDVTQANNRYRFTCFVRGFDDDAVRLLFDGHYTAGDVTQHAVFSVPGLRDPGTTGVGGNDIVLAFVPDDLMHADGVVIYRGIPWWTEDAEVAFQKGAEFGIPLQVDCLRNSNDHTLKIGRLPDLPLT